MSELYDIKKINKHLTKQDKILGKCLKSLPEFNLVPSDRYFEILISSIISQQISLKAAESIKKRVLEALSQNLHPNSVLACPDEQLRACGLSWAKVGYLKNIASHFIENPEIYTHLENLTDVEATKALCEIKGIGEWTAQMFLMFTLVRLNVLPTGDVGLQNGVQKIYNLSAKPTKKELIAIGEKWQPYRSVAVWYIWRILDSSEFTF